MTHLTFIVAADKPWKAARDLLEMTLDEIGIKYTLKYEREGILSTEEIAGGGSIPQDTVIYVHGNFGERYINVSTTRELARRRPDLKFIIAIDPGKCNGEDFATREDYTLVHQFFERERGFHARHQINVSMYDPASFITGRDTMRNFEPIEESLGRYVQQWKELQGGLR